MARPKRQWKLRPPKPVGERVPPESDVFWVVATAPLLHHLKTEGPKSWHDLYAWAHVHKITIMKLKNLVAWLENKKLVTYDGERRWEVAEP